MSGMLFFPPKDASAAVEGKWPVVIWLHEYSYAQGIVNKGPLISALLDAGIAVCIYDQLGFGTRNEEEARLFYQRYPKWSKMGRMVADVRWAVDALIEDERIDLGKIFVAGYSVGATTGLYSAALDERIAGVVSVCGFTPMRTNTEGKTAEGIYEYSHLHGLIPRLGFFAGTEERIPYDFHEILACIAPRPIMVIAPTWDQHANHLDVSRCMEEVKKVYHLLGAGGHVSFHAPDDYNRFSPAMQKLVTEWLSAQ
jgi:dienelactone hydrolase